MAGGARGMGCARIRNPGPCPPRCKARGVCWGNAVCRSWHLVSLLPPISSFPFWDRKGSREAGVMASNYVDTAVEEGRFHGHGHSTTPTGAAASPKTTRRSWSSAASASSGGGHGYGAGPKCVCAPATHAGSFKCRLHRSGSHSHPSSPPSPATAAAPSSSSRTVAAQ